jgi:hypothetical protein
MRQLFALAALCLAWTGCGNDEPIGSCGVYVPQEVAGTYRFGRQPPENLVEATLEAGAETIILEYQTEDGSRFRATYRVTKKRDSRDDWSVYQSRARLSGR